MKTFIVPVGNYRLGGGNPIVIQSMTDTNTEHVARTVKQIQDLADAGSELVRITVHTPKAAKAVPKIKEKLCSNGYNHVALIGDFHFNGDLLLERFPECAKSLDKYRINPGNAGDKGFRKIIHIARDLQKPVRIGVNQGSLDKRILKQSTSLVEASIKSALQSARLARTLGLLPQQIVLSIKMSTPKEAIEAYEKLYQKLQNEKTPYPLHLGVTEAGSGMKGLISSTVAMSTLLLKGIGDTIRYSLTPQSSDQRTQEVEACKILLQSLGLRYFTPETTSCPGCGRTDPKVFQNVVMSVNRFIADQLPRWKKRYPGVELMRVALMGCIVNGPGESKHADIGLSFPGRTEKPLAQIYKNGKLFRVIEAPIAEQFKKILEEYVHEKYNPLRKL